MESVESMVENLASMGKNSLDVLEEIEKSSQEHYTKQVEQMDDLSINLEQLRNKQQEQLIFEERSFNLSRENALEHRENLRFISDKLETLHGVLSGFVGCCFDTFTNACY